MKSKQFIFFGKKTDFQEILQEVESKKVLKYFQTGLFDEINIVNYNSLLDYRNLGNASFGSQGLNDCFLIIANDKELKIRSVPQRKGGVKYAVDQLINEESIIIEPGGVFKNDIFVAGRIGTVKDDAFSKELYNLFFSLIKRRFTKIGNCYVGKTAKEKLDSGWRFVLNDSSPKEYDLKAV
ncbi:hypothetical protein C8C83_0891 [Flavobacterium sp. 90]|uniref:hypothetical protein n=1 Tax=unclassified Flavobacterium TaxID=196869 RepID=UPI000EB39260|nr:MULTISPECIES: hypothetical protein [unclassified Flavobacterium]RKR09271.1 hypothetical protein C8C82_1191 [Flavobacterium sp. 81]TCK53054.1 hypothetical protein C8C83_0891 [Flavobacterium sp. 90]